MITTFANIKGGAGKTTGTMHLGKAIAQTNQPVAVVDSDRQGSALRWAEIARRAGEPLPFEVVSLATTMIGLRIDDIAANQSVVIDCGPGDADIMAAAIEVADVVVIPANAREDDIEQARKTVKQCNALGIPYGVLFSRIRSSESSATDFRADLTSGATPIHVFSTEIPELVRLGFAFGSQIDDVSPFDQLLKEIEGLIS